MKGKGEEKVCVIRQNPFSEAKHVIWHFILHMSNKYKKIVFAACNSPCLSPGSYINVTDYFRIFSTGTLL